MGNRYSIEVDKKIFSANQPTNIPHLFKSFKTYENGNNMAFPSVLFSHQMSIIEQNCIFSPNPLYFGNFDFNNYSGCMECVVLTCFCETVKQTWKTAIATNAMC